MVNDSRIALVVMNENTLGYIHPSQPNALHILQSSVLMGGNLPNDGQSVYIHPSDEIRLANSNDFQKFRIHFGGYQNDEVYKFSLN